MVSIMFGDAVLRRLPVISAALGLVRGKNNQRASESVNC
jgi:hypothetical protein